MELKIQFKREACESQFFSMLGTIRMDVNSLFLVQPSQKPDINHTNDSAMFDLPLDIYNCASGLLGIVLPDSLIFSWVSAIKFKFCFMTLRDQLVMLNFYFLSFQAEEILKLIS